MRGYRLIDDRPQGIAADHGRYLFLSQRADELGYAPLPGDLVAFAYMAGVPLRAGHCRVKAASRVDGGWALEMVERISDAVPTATSADAVYVATAIGEAAFSRVN